MKFRAYLGLTVTCLLLLLSDPVQRFIIVPWVWLFPSQRSVVLGRWINIMAWLVTRPLQRISGAHLPPPLRAIPSEPGVLILMNHQSLFDIPLVVQALDGGYPRIVTRKRYGHWVPLISHMIKVYQYPLVDPTANRTETQEGFDMVRDSARSSEVPFVVFPEGTRTKDGQISSFRRRGLRGVLRTRPWKVYVVVGDGLWERPRLKDFLGGLSQVRGRIELAGTLEWPDPEADTDALIDAARELMVGRLASMRGEAQLA